MNSIYNNTKQIHFRSVQDLQYQDSSTITNHEPNYDNAQLPDLYQNNLAKPGQEKFETLRKMDVMELIVPWLEHPIAMVLTALGLSTTVDLFGKAFGGEYEKSLLGKVANLGDKIQTSKVVQSEPSKKTIKGLKKGSNHLKKILEKSDFFRSIMRTPSQPEWKICKDELLSMQQRVIHDFSQIATNLNLTTPEHVQFAKLGATKAEIMSLKTFFEGKIPNEIKASNALQLKRLGLDDSTIKTIVNSNNAIELVKQEHLKKFNIDADFLKRINTETATPEDIQKICEAAKKTKDVRVRTNPKNPIDNALGMDEIRNKLVSMRESKTKLGKAFATFVQKCYRGLTFGGGKTGVLFWVTPHIMHTILDVKKADAKEKVSTAVFGLVSAISWVFTFPIALQIMHHLAGIKYAGMKSEDVKEYRKLLEEFNEKAHPFKEKSFFKNLFGFGKRKTDADNKFKSYDEYKAARKELKRKLKEIKSRNVGKQSMLTKFFKKIGKFVTIDLETVNSYRGGNIFANGIRRIPTFLKNFVGIPMRFGIWGALSIGLLDTLINKSIRGCFGNYYDRFKVDELKENKRNQKNFTIEDLQDRLYELQADKIAGPLPVQNEFIIPEKLQEELDKEKELKIAREAEEMKEQQRINNSLLETNSLSKIKKNENINNTTIEELKSPENEEFKAESTQELASKIEPETETGLSQSLVSEIEPEIIPPSTQELDSEVETENSSESTQDLAYEIEPESDFSTNNINENLTTTNNQNTRKIVDNYTYIPNQNSIISNNDTDKKLDSYTYIPSSENVLNNTENSNKTNKYIPSQHGANISKSFDNSGLEAALKRADRAEKRALEVLAGNFEGF